MAKKRAKKPKLVKNRSFSLIKLRIANRNDHITSNRKPIIRKNGKKTRDQAYQATNSRPTKLQLAKIMDFEKRRLAKRLAPALFFKIESPNFNILPLTTSPNKHSKDLWKLSPYVEKIDFEGGPR